MAANIRALVGSSIFRKQISAITGLAMIGFVIAHLSGNLLIYGGPEMFNGYTEKLHEVEELLWIMRFGLIISIILHVVITLTLARENSRARDTRYQVTKDHGDRKMATRFMKYTGILIVFFLALHLYDFTFGDKHGDATIVEGLNNGESLGLFGLVWNSFSIEVNWWRVLIYEVAVIAVGLHLSHAIESLLQTIGFNHDRYTPTIRKASLAIGILIAIGFGSIPVYVALAPSPFGV